MQLEVLNDELRRLIGEAGYRPAGWTDSEIRHARLLAQCAGAAKIQSDLQTLRVLGLRLDTDSGAGTWSVQLSIDRRLVVTFKSDSTPITAVFDVLSSGTEKSP